MIMSHNENGLNCSFSGPVVDVKDKSDVCTCSADGEWTMEMHFNKIFIACDTGGFLRSSRRSVSCSELVAVGSLVIAAC